MLGAGTWFVGIAVPIVITGGFIASRKRLAYQWREELMDPDGGNYPAITATDMEFFRRVSPPQQGGAEKGVPLSVKENIGLRVCPDTVSTDESHVLLDEVVRWASLFGQKIDQKKVAFVENRAALEDIEMRFYKEMSIISDHAEDIQLMKAPWGTGDGIKYEMMPATLRYIVNKTQKTFDGIGRLRHVYVEYSPSGKFYHEPRATRAFDGHDYVVIPLRRDKAATVITFSPLLRSRYAFIREVLEDSWTSRDIDAIIPPGGALRVYGTARYEWGWGIRPGNTWFGHRHNSFSKSAAISAQGGIMRRVKDYLYPNDVAHQAKDSEAALVVLHFEGPRDINKQRSLLLHPECLIFGNPPVPETYERWVEERPTQEVVRGEGVFLFMVKNYLEMLKVS